jgi:hypothetical protein
MVLQVMSRAIREIAPERKRDNAWLWATTNGSKRRTASRLFRPRRNDKRIANRQSHEVSGIEPG